MNQAIYRIALVLLLFLLSPLAFAQATRTWVSGVGDDANPCSRTAPCKTFAGAISKTAAGGEIDALDPGGFGAVTITKAMTIDGGGGQVASVLSSGVNGIVINAAATDVVVLRNLRINGAGSTLGTNAIRFLAGKQLVVEHVEISNYSVNGIDVALNQTTNAGLVVHDVNFTSIGAIAVSLTNSSSGAVQASLSQVAVRGAASGVLTNSANVSADVSNSTFVQLSSFCLHAVLGSITADTNILAGSTTAVRAESSAAVRLSNNGIYNNNTGIGGPGPTPTANNNRNAGNITPGTTSGGSITIQ